MTDEQLAQRAAAGDTRAFDQLVDRHAASCLRYASRMLGSDDDAQEVTQDAWVRAHRALPSFNPSSVFRTWLYAILINRCRTALAARTRRDRLVRPDSGAVDSATTSSVGDRVTLRIELSRALGKLSPDLREAFLLKHVEQLEYSDMAEMLGASISALKMRVQRACLQLRIELRDYDDAR